MNQLQENESSNEGREMEGMEFLEESPLEPIKKIQYRARIRRIGTKRE